MVNANNQRQNVVSDLMPQRHMGSEKTNFKSQKSIGNNSFE